MAISLRLGNVKKEIATSVTRSRNDGGAGIERNDGVAGIARKGGCIPVFWDKNRKIKKFRQNACQKRFCSV